MATPNRSARVSAIAVVLAAASLLVLPQAATSESPSPNKEQAAFLRFVESRNRRATDPVCETTGADELKIVCDYTAIPGDKSNAQRDPRIVLNRFAVSFNAHKQCEMRVELTFTNGGNDRISDGRTIYLAVDDDAGHNYLRRALPQVDFRTIAPGESTTFSGQLLSGAFMPGHYVFHLWIPSADPSLKFNSTYNLPLSSEGVSDTSTGLNMLVEFTVTDGAKR